MDLTPGLENDVLHTPSHTASMSYPHPSSSSAQTPQPQEQSMQHSQSQGQSSGPKFSNGPHIRSRITVVCAECKRLKLKCDRRTPCGSCLKRDTVTRCIYSQAASEKIDVQTLHNRLCVVESALGTMFNGAHSPLLAPVYAELSPQAKELIASMGSPDVVTPNRTAPVQPVAPVRLHAHPSSDRALIAVGASGSSVLINLEDVASIWLVELDELNPSSTSASELSTNPAGSSGGARVKLEPTPVLMPPVPSLLSASRDSFSPGRLNSTFVPPVPYETFLPSASAPSTHVATSTNMFPPAIPSTNLNETPQVTLVLLNRLPPASARAQYMHALEETMALHPCFNVKHFTQRMEAMFVWGDAGGFNFPPSNSVKTGAPAPANSMKALAHEVFYGQPPANGKPSKVGKDVGRSTVPHHGAGSPPKPTLSFFAAASAAFALGALASGGDPPGDLSSDGSSGEESERCNPAALFALSEQALALFEKTSLYDLDAVIAMVLQILYQLHDGQMSVAQGVFPLVSKAINVARMMGLANDPDEFPGTYSLFEAETRRRVWWDIFYYDLYISDCMGHPPLIPDNSFTTRMPAEVDEEHFSPSSTTLPAVPSGEGIERGTTYFTLKCRLAQLVKNVKKQTFKDPLSEDPSELSIEQAANFEAEVTTFLSTLPPTFCLELHGDLADLSLPSSVSPRLQAQKCELAILANRLILKLYLPFLKEASSAGAARHQAVFGTVNAAHQIINASRMLHFVWKQTRPAAFDFYDFGRALFDASVICAHAVIQQPTHMLAAEAIKSVGNGLDVLRELGASKSGVEGVRGEGNKAEAIRIVEAMRRKAEAARSGSSGSSNNATVGLKRKRSLLDDDRSSFRLPFVGASVTSVRPDQSKTLISPSKVAAAKDASIYDGKSKPDSKRQAKEKDRDKDKDKTQKYSPVSIRSRPSQGPPTSRTRTASVSSNAPPPLNTNLRPESSTPSVPPLLPVSSSHSQGMIQRSSAVESPSVTGFEHYPPPRPSNTPVNEQMQRDDYPMHYPSDEDKRRYSSVSFADSPRTASLFDQASLSQPSPVSYSTGPTPPGYFQYPPASGPSYDHSALSQSHGLPPMAGLPPPPPMLDPPSAGGMTMSAMPPSQYAQYDKQPQYHMSRPPSHSRPMTHEYQPQPQPPSQSMPMSGSQGWLQPDLSGGSDMWTEYKYMG
ncbi:uncharacterized protein FIBRA_07863 [Fibroporia radiculosa]|uniref:Zn(2)-C6 fungal-type domain-containing protein n=1 Tax=Fibroporia radiculosa TaxID=599839 RepID=J4H4V2_9APHY|nr:uncharacterized protein FIBRA_07863 [Fibroporia radiculosa]CCM05634.1 predicted protein [Fibroporia radiculosa]